MSSSSQMKVIVPDVSGDSQNYQFTLDANADCFCCYYYLSSPKLVGMSLYNEKQEEFYPQKEYEDLYREGLFVSKGNPSMGIVQSINGSIAFSVPIAEDESVDLTSLWTASLSDTDNFELKVTQRIVEDKPISEYVLKVNLVLYSSGTMQSQQVAWITKAQKRIKAIFRQVPITCQFSKIDQYPLPDNKITINFNDPNTAKIVKDCAKADELTVIFIEGLVTDIGTEHETANAIGRSGGIPGPQGFVNQYAATLIKLTDKADDPFVVNKGLLANTVAHEMAHYLGLTHESGQDASGKVEPNNLMAAHGGIAMQQLNEKQKYILSHMPLVQAVYSDRELSEITPVTQLEIAVTTGTRSYAGGTSDNTNMVLNFSLGSDEDGFQTWMLDSSGTTNYLVPGTTTVFQLQEIEDLYMEDLYNWKIFCDWDRDVQYPMNFQTVTNYWDLAHIKITANGTVIEDTDMNVILSWIVQTTIQKQIKTN